VSDAPTLRTAVSAIVLVRNDGAALMQHRDDKPGIPHAGMWTPPGGHVEPGESMEECARREFLEETGYRLGTLYFLDRFLDDGATGFPPLWLTVFWSQYDGRQPIVCREGQALEFIDRHRVSEYAIPQYLIDLWDRAWRASRELVGVDDASQAK
jgi:8-oxo-dGTP pyrophosphatase MutT (NUDIX family)